MAELKWPWVSRHRLTAAEKALEEANKERRELLDRLLGAETAPERPRQIRHADDVEPAEQDEQEPPENQGEVVQFTTPFDRIETRWKQSFSKGKVPPAQYRARG